MARTAAEPKYRFNRKGAVVRDTRRRDSDGALVPRHSSASRREYQARSGAISHPGAPITSWHEDRNELPNLATGDTEEIMPGVTRLI